MSLIYMGQQMTIYGGYFFLFTGLVGNGVNVFVFSSVRTYRTTPCAFYFLVCSIDNIIYIMINLISRIVAVGYGVDLTGTSVIWCKTRQFFLNTPALISLTCSCLAAIDQFLATSQSVYLRSCSNMKSAYRILFIMIIIWFLHGILRFFFYDISYINHTCMIINSGYATYFVVYILVFLFAIPILVMVVFGYLTYRNIHRTIVLSRQNADHQLVIMVLIQIVLVIISMIPIGIYTTYIYVTSKIAKDNNQKMIENFIAIFFSLISYFYFAGNFYIFFISSSKFRQNVKDRLFCWLRRNQVNPS